MTAQETIRVLVAEDHHVVRQGLVALLKVVQGIEVVGEAADGVEAIAQFRKCQPNVTLIDLRMPRLSGVEVIQRIRMETPRARFIVLTTYDGDEDIYRALQAGARAYLLKGMTTDDLVSTIRTVHAGKSHIPPAVAQRLAERVGTEELTASSRRAATLRAVLAYSAAPVVEFAERRDDFGGPGVRIYRYHRPVSWEGLRP